MIERLAGYAPRHVESHLALARETLAAQLWGEARRHLQNAIDTAGAPTSGISRLMARLEQEEKGDGEAARAWLAKAAEAPRDPGWICGACGTVHPQWQAICGHCGAFDRIAWSAPTRVASAGAMLPVAAGAGSAAGTQLPAVVDEKRGPA
jgi:HemY protein